MKKYFMGVVLSLLTLSTILFQNLANADEATREKLAVDVVGVMGLVNQFKSNLPLMQNQLLMTLARKYPAASDETIVKIQKLSDNFIIEIVSKAHPAFIKIISDRFNEEELTDILAFYKSKSGQAFIKKQPTMSKDMMDWTNTAMMESMLDMDKKVEKMIADGK